MNGVMSGMKARESHMPNQDMWESFFNPEQLLLDMGIGKANKLVVDVGSGYGTFSFAAADIIDGIIVGFDIEADMVDACNNIAIKNRVCNSYFEVRNVFEEGFGLDDGVADGVFLFNILHCENPQWLIAEAHRVLENDGKLYVMHWVYDAGTPRGPSLAIRPTPESLIRLISDMGFLHLRLFDIKPYHYGIVFSKRSCLDG